MSEFANGEPSITQPVAQNNSSVHKTEQMGRISPPGTLLDSVRRSQDQDDDENDLIQIKFREEAERPLKDRFIIFGKNGPDDILAHG
jgi:hypothetical protein